MKIVNNSVSILFFCKKMIYKMVKLSIIGCNLTSNINVALGLMIKHIPHFNTLYIYCKHVNYGYKDVEKIFQLVKDGCDRVGITVIIDKDKEKYIIDNNDSNTIYILFDYIGKYVIKYLRNDTHIIYIDYAPNKISIYKIGNPYDENEYCKDYHPEFTVDTLTEELKKITVK